MKVLTSLVLDALRELSDLDFQQRVWVVGSPTEVSSLNEAVATLFDDSGLDQALERKSVTYSPGIDEQLGKLAEALRALNEKYADYSTAERIKTSEWSRIRGDAKHILEQLQTMYPTS